MGNVLNTIWEYGHRMFSPSLANGLSTSTQLVENRKKKKQRSIQPSRTFILRLPLMVMLLFTADAPTFIHQGHNLKLNQSEAPLHFLLLHSLSKYLTCSSSGGERKRFSNSYFNYRIIRDHGETQRVLFPIFNTLRTSTGVMEQLISS